MVKILTQNKLSLFIIVLLSQKYGEICDFQLIKNVIKLNLTSFNAHRWINYTKIEK